MIPASPFHDPTKPDPPYTTGRRLKVQSHIAPPPTTVTRGWSLMKRPEREELGKFSSVERCIRHPPLPGQLGTFSVELEIVDLIQIGDLYNAQLFTVNILVASSGLQSWPIGKKIIAKVYDPLYIDEDCGYIDPFKCADKHYTHEVEAYKVLSEFQGGLIPGFYGSYSLNVDCPGLTQQRTVRLILLEYIPGQSMQQVKPTEQLQSTRQHIMKTVIDFESLMFSKDIIHGDMAPRNVILMSPELNTSRNVVFVDFASTIFGRKRDDELKSFASQEQLFLGQYVSPLLRWKKRSPREFKEWVDWEWRSWIQAEFKHTARSITDGMRARYEDSSADEESNEG